MAQGTPVILCDSMINSDNYTSLVNPDPSTAAKPLAEWLAKQMHYKGNLLYIGGLPGNGTTILYDKGFNAVMKKYPNIKIVNGGNANYSISTAKQLTATALASGKKFDGTWGVGGEAVTGILQAYVDAKIKPIPPNAGAAATNGSLRLAIENKVDAAMLQFPPADSKVCIETAYKAMQGPEGAEAHQHLGAQGVRQPLPAAQALLQAQYSDDLYVGTDDVLYEEGACCDPSDQVAATRRGSSSDGGLRGTARRGARDPQALRWDQGARRRVPRGPPAEIHALVGENGAGKSTLVKVITGAQSPDAGTVSILGEPSSPLTPEKARELGIGAVYQEPSLVPYLTVLENMFLGRELRRVPGVLGRRAMRRQARAGARPRRRRRSRSAARSRGSASPSASSSRSHARSRSTRAS